MITRSRVLITAGLALAILCAASLGTYAMKAARKSPQGFNAPQCTWWVDRHCAENGWDLKFSQNHGRDAWLWPTLLENAAEIPAPQPGCILVFAPWAGGSVGHVAYVETVTADRFEISHANFRVGTVVATVQGAEVRRVEMRIAERAGSAQFVGGGDVFGVRYFAKR